MSQAIMMKARVETKNPYLVMMGLYLGAFIGMFSETSLNIALPQLMNVFQVSAAYAQWMVVGYMLVIGLVLPFASFIDEMVLSAQFEYVCIGGFYSWRFDERLCQLFWVAFGRTYDSGNRYGFGAAYDVCVGA